MNKILVALCPNCHTDASKHNKVLYEGIFLICHSCGYGWYYNIQIINSPHNNVHEQREYHSQSAPLGTLNPKGENPHKSKNHNPPVSKRNIKTKTNREASSHQLKNPNYNKKSPISDVKVNANYTPSPNNIDNNKSRTKKLTHNVNIDSYKNSKGTVTYNNNIYYQQFATINNESEKISIPLAVNSTDPISTTPVSTKLNSSPISLKPATQPLSEVNTNSNIPPNKNILHKEANTVSPKSDSLNYKGSSHQTVFNTQKTPLTSSNNLSINLANLPSKQSLNKPNVVAKTEQATNIKNHSEAILPNTNIDSPPVSDSTTKEKTSSNNPNLINTVLPKNDTPITTATVKNNKEEITSYANKEIPFTPSIIPKDSEKSSAQENKINKQSEPINLVKESTLTTTLNNTVDNPITQETPTNTHNEILEKSDLNYSTHNIAPNPIDKIKNNDLKLALSNFNMSLNSKETLGLSPSSLLKIEEQSQYNLNRFNQNKPVKEPLSLNIKEYTSHIKDSINYLFKGIYKVITRPDLLLKTCAYIFIFSGIISFLWYSNQMKHKKIKETSIHNPSFNNQINNSSSDNVSFDSNVDINGLNQSGTSASNPAFNEPKISITKEETNNKVIAFQKNANQDNSSLPNENNLSHKKVNISEPTFIESLTYKAKDTWLTIKHLQQNAFNHIKVYQKRFHILGENNDQLVSNTTLYNNDINNSYLVKSLEIVFLEKTGKIVGKRIILTNQIVNRNSAIDLNLKINNPPLGVNNVYVYINDKQKI